MKKHEDNFSFSSAKWIVELSSVYQSVAHFGFKFPGPRSLQAETMLNARTVKDWLLKVLVPERVKGPNMCAMVKSWI